MDGVTTIRPDAPAPAADPQNGVLARLPPRDATLLGADLQRVVLEQGQVLALPGAPMACAWFPEGSMMAALSVVMADGRMAVTGTVARDGAIGLMEAMGNGIAQSRVMVAMPGPALRVATPKLAMAARRSPGLRELIGRCNQETADHAMQMAACSALHSVRQRICRWILTTHDCVRDADGEIAADRTVLPLTQEMLGDILGVQRTTITVVAMKLQQAGLVRYGRGRVTVLDRPGLLRESCECHGVLRRRRQKLLAEPVTA